MRRHQSRRAQPRDRTEAETNDRHLRHLVRHQVERCRLGQTAGQVGASCGLDRLHRTAAARSFNQANDRHAELRRDLLRHLGLALDGGVGRSTAQREVIAGDDHWPPIHGAAPEYAVSGNETDDVAFRIIARLAGDAADFLEAARIEQSVYALTHGQAATRVLPGDTVLATELACQRLPLAQLGQFGFPTN